MRQRLELDWETFTFEALQANLREIVDRIEVDGTECTVFLRP